MRHHSKNFHSNLRECERPYSYLSDAAGWLFVAFFLLMMFSCKTRMPEQEGRILFFDSTYETSFMFTRPDTFVLILKADSTFWIKEKGFNYQISKERARKIYDSLNHLLTIEKIKQTI